MQLLGSRNIILVVPTSTWPVVLAETAREKRSNIPEVSYNYFYDGCWEREEGVGSKFFSPFFMSSKHSLNKQPAVFILQSRWMSLCNRRMHHSISPHISNAGIQYSHCSFSCLLQTSNSLCINPSEQLFLHFTLGDIKLKYSSTWTQKPTALSSCWGQRMCCYPVLWYIQQYNTILAIKVQNELLKISFY